MDPNHEYVGVDGVTMHYVREGSGFPLVFLHGWPEFWRTWRKNLPALADSFDVVAPDLRGFGDSDNPDTSPGEGYGIAAHVDDLRGFVDELGFETVGLVSHDLGAHVAQSFAREHPDRVAGLFFFDCPYPGIGDRWLDPDHLGEIWYQSFNQQPWAADLVGTSRETVRHYIGHFLRHWAGDPDAFAEDLDAWVDNFAAPGNLQGGFDWYVAADERRTGLMRDGAPDLPAIETPTAVRWGELDPVLRVEWADRLDDYFADLDFESVPDAGHFAHYERSELANEEIASFFETMA